ncbi:Hypothetical protein D9617_4g001150 [Elsinoe fawcettii]|nr:Hypothetical protein D9617_4g001150 [Elsinoe fawcettii]
MADKQSTPSKTGFSEEEIKAIMATPNRDNAIFFLAHAAAHGLSTPSRKKVVVTPSKREDATRSKEEDGSPRERNGSR